MLIRPDPEHPAGGYAVLSLPGHSALPDAMTVSVMETFGGRWLAPSAEDASGRIGIGDPNWQPVAHGFGSYATRRVGDQVELILGPEIVNKIEGYTRVRLLIGPVDIQTDWPDTLTPLAGARGLGGLHVTRKPAAPAEAGPVLRQTQAGPIAQPIPPPATVKLPDPPLAVPVQVKRGSISGIVAVVFLLLAAIGLGSWYWWQSRPEPQVAGVLTPAPTATPPPTPAPTPSPTSAPASTPAAATDTCTAQYLRALPGGFADLPKAVADCGHAISTDDLLGIIEDAAKSGNGDALILFGKIYDSSAEDAIFENGAGLTLVDNPAQAAEYYAKARDAGAAQGAALLTAACKRLATASDTLSQGAFHDYCHA